MCSSQTQTVALVTEQSLIVTQPLSLLPQLPESASLVAGRSSSHTPQLPDSLFALRHSNTMRHPVAAAHTEALSPQSQPHAATEFATVLKSLNHRPPRRYSPTRNFSLPTNHPEQTRNMGRYYTSALTSADQLALARGDKNHNLKLWTPKDVITYEEARKDLIPTNAHNALQRKVRITPVTVVIQGHTIGLTSGSYFISP